MLTKIRDKLWIDIEKIIYVKLGENYTKTRCLIISFINENNIVLYSEEDITVFESALEKYYNELKREDIVINPLAAVGYKSGSVCLYDTSKVKKEDSCKPIDSEYIFKSGRWLLTAEYEKTKQKLIIELMLDRAISIEKVEELFPGMNIIKADKTN